MCMKFDARLFIQKITKGSRFLDLRMSKLTYNNKTAVDFT